jgi:hypothetical protein
MNYTDLEQMEDVFTLKDDTFYGSVHKTIGDSTITVSNSMENGISYHIDGHICSREDAVCWWETPVSSKELKKLRAEIKSALAEHRAAQEKDIRVVTRTGYKEIFCEAIDKASQVFEMFMSSYSSPIEVGVREGMIRWAINELIYAHNYLESMTSFGSKFKEIDEKTAVISPYNLKNFLNSSRLSNDVMFLKGAISDPFINLQVEDAGIGMSMHQHAAMNVRKAQFILKNRIDFLLKV